MSISDYISAKNKIGEKILSVFLTAGFPGKDSFTDLALEILDAGADMLEIGFPFSDPLADGPTIQYSSLEALKKGITLKEVFNYVELIRKKNDKPVILMGYANPVLNYGINKFAADAINTGVNGVIIPDVPIDEYENFYSNSFDNLDVILLSTPTTSEERIKLIDKKSRGFLYYVSITGTTGNKLSHQNLLNNQLKNIRNLVTKNPLLIGFGISSPEDAKILSPYCDGIIVGSAIIKSLMNRNGSYQPTIELVKTLKNALS